jgi:hypothetical protein
MFQISIDYQRKEYLAFTREVLSLEIEKEKLDKWYVSFPMNVFFSLVFWVKMQKEGTCVLEFDEKGFTRKSKSGKSIVAWENLKNVQELKDIYLLAGQHKGGVPIPKRCFTSEQKELFGSFCAKIITKGT